MELGVTVTGHNLTDGEIAAYEAGARIRLPPQYRAFLKRKNGFLPLQMMGPSVGVRTDLAEFFPLFTKEKRGNRMTVEYANDLIWFAMDSGGGRFGLAHTGRNFG